MSMHIRLKRRTSTVFLHVDPSESFSSIKERLAAVLNVDAAAVQIRELASRKELVDMATVSDQGIRNDDVVLFVLAKETGGWEEVAVDPLSLKPNEHKNDD